METTPPPPRERPWPLAAEPDYATDVLVVHVLVRQAQPTAWIVLRRGQFLDSHDTQPEAVRFGRQVAAAHRVRCWVSVFDRLIDVSDVTVGH